MSTNVLSPSADAEAQFETNARAARDESRLGMIAYWLVRYADAGYPGLEEKFRGMKKNLETEDARAIADAWFQKKKMSGRTSNRFAPIADDIWKWAEAMNDPKRRIGDRRR